LTFTLTFALAWSEVAGFAAGFSYGFTGVITSSRRFDGVPLRGERDSSAVGVDGIALVSRGPPGGGPLLGREQASFETFRPPRSRA
jgi:hypothetical protein